MRGGFWIDYGFPASRFPIVPFVRILDGGADPSLISGRIVLLAPDYGWNDWTSPEQVDRFPVPGGPAGGVPGTVLQAYAVETLLSARRIAIAPFWLDALALATFVFALGLINRITRTTPRVALMAGVLALALLGQSQLFLVSGLSLNSSCLAVSAALVIVASSVLRLAELRRRLRRATGFDSRLYDAFLESVRSLPEKTVEREATILVADIRGYTEYTAPRTRAGAPPP